MDMYQDMSDMHRKARKALLVMVVALAALNVYQFASYRSVETRLHLVSIKSRGIAPRESNDTVRNDQGVGVILVHEKGVVDDDHNQDEESDSEDDIRDEVERRKQVLEEAKNINWMPALGPEEENPRAAIYRAHDLLQDKVHTYDPNFKNPCWYEGGGSGTRTLRCLPYVFVIGVKKCGTSDLFSRLSKHPDFVHPGFKEAQFFARGRFRDKASDNIEEYINRFDKAADNISSHMRKGSDGQWYNNWTITGEASPSNLHLNNHWQYLPGNENLNEPRYVILDYIHHFLPRAKIIILFRDPIERLYSDYYHEYGTLMPKNSPNPGEFHDVVVKGLRLYRDCFARRSVRSCVYDPEFYQQTSIQIQLGIYYIFWEELTRVYPRDQILVLQNKDLKDKEKTMKIVYEFLGLRKLTEKEMEKVVQLTEENTMEQHNKTRIPMLNETYKLLLAFYQPFNLKFSGIMRDTTFLYIKRNTTNLTKTKVKKSRIIR